MVRLAALGLTASVTSPAAADMISSWHLGDWSAAAYSNNETKAFEHCRGDRPTDTGGSFSVAQMHNTHWVLLFTSAAHFQKPVGTPLRIGIRIDQGQPLPLNVRVINDKVLQGGLPDNSKLLEAIGR